MIELKNVSFAYPGQQAGRLEELSLTIPDGECVLLCGRSGCGKTTLTRLLNGLIPHFFAGELRGSVTVNGLDTAAVPMYALAGQVGSVFQNPRTQFFNVDTDSEIAFGMENRALPRAALSERVQAAADALNLRPLLGRTLFELSGGEKQKIAFASIWATDPAVFLLDEPSGNLDMASIAELGAHLRQAKAAGKTIVIAEHRLHYLMELADRVIYLENGRIAGSFTPAEFLALPRPTREGMGLRTPRLAEETLRGGPPRGRRPGAAGGRGQPEKADAVCGAVADRRPRGDYRPDRPERRGQKHLLPRPVRAAQGLHRQLCARRPAAGRQGAAAAGLPGHAGCELRAVCRERGRGMCVRPAPPRPRPGGFGAGGA